MNFTDEIKKTIHEGMPDAEIHIQDPWNDGAHLEAIVISLHFEGKPLIQQHRMVMERLKGHFEEDLHALTLKTYTPKQWEEVHERSKGN